jgi:hypothetical protein
MLRKVRPDLAVKAHCIQEKESRPQKKAWHPKPTKADGTASTGINLVIKGYINGHPVNKMLVDTGAAVNIMPYSVLCWLGRSVEDMIKTNVTLSHFNGQAIETQGALNVDLTVGSKTFLTSFFIVSSKSTYTVLVRRDWIHANCCIPSTMTKCLIQWDGHEVEVVHADDSIEISHAALSIWDGEDQEPISGISLEGCDHVEATKNGVRLVLSTDLIE